MTSRTRLSLLPAGLLALALGVSACGSNNTSTSTGSSATTGASSGSSSAQAAGGGKCGTVALLLPESKTTRYESFDRPLFESRFKELCPNSEVLYSNADQDAAKQQQQAESALTNGAKVLVLDAVDGDAAVSIVNRAKSQGVPVIAYDRIINNAPIDYYISFDNEKVGQLQGEALLNALGGGGSGKSIVMINGSPTDPNAASFKKGAHSVLDGKVTIAKEYDTPDWSPDNAQQEMEQAITALGKNKIDGVYAANDGTAGGAIAAMQSAGFNPIPPVTGQDAELAAIQRIVAGTQYMTVYKPIKPEAQGAAEAAAALLKGGQADSTSMVSNGSGNVAATLLQPIVVTKDNIKDTVVKDGFYSVSDICTQQYASACAAIGLS